MIVVMRLTAVTAARVSAWMASMRREMSSVARDVSPASSLMIWAVARTGWFGGYRRLLSSSSAASDRIWTVFGGSV